LELIDWIILGATLLIIAIYGIYKTRKSASLESYLLGSRKETAWTICISVMATQASAITFLSTPGQAYEDGLRFVQFYFGLPLAMVILSVTLVPSFVRSGVFTAFEFLEKKFDHRVRALTAFLFLVQRGLAAGITIYAPAIIFTTVLNWDLTFTIIGIGGFVTLYSISGGSAAVAVTQQQQMAVMMGGMLLAAGLIIYQLPVDLNQTFEIAGILGKVNPIDFKFNWSDRYNFWSGITGGLFLALAYFGTDQSQVARYLSGKSEGEIKTGLMMNGLFKVPMQFLILCVGLLVFVFYQFNPSPIHFNRTQYAIAKEKDRNETLIKYEHQLAGLQNERNILLGNKEIGTEENKAQLLKIYNQEKKLRNQAKQEISSLLGVKEVKDTDYVFISFILDYMPKGVIGLLIAMILCAGMSSTASELNALAGTTAMDFYRRYFKKNSNDEYYVIMCKIFTFLWGILAILFALLASRSENLIQAVNILGSLFYGTILGIFVSAFYFKNAGGLIILIAACLSQALIITLFLVSDIGFLWYNMIGCLVVSGIAGLTVSFKKIKSHS